MTFLQSPLIPLYRMVSTSGQQRKEYAKIKNFKKFQNLKFQNFSKIQKTKSVTSVIFTPQWLRSHFMLNQERSTPWVSDPSRTNRPWELSEPMKSKAIFSHHKEFFADETSRIRCSKVQIRQLEINELGWERVGVQMGRGGEGWTRGGGRKLRRISASDQGRV